MSTCRLAGSSPIIYEESTGMWMRGIHIAREDTVDTVIVAFDGERWTREHYEQVRETCRLNPGTLDV